MSKEEIKDEIHKVLDQFPEKDLEAKQTFASTRANYLQHILSEDPELLKRLAQ